MRTIGESYDHAVRRTGPTPLSVGAGAKQPRPQLPSRFAQIRVREAAPRRSVSVRDCFGPSWETGPGNDDLRGTRTGEAGAKVGAMTRPSSTQTAEARAQLAGFIDKYHPSVGRRLRSCRAALRKRLPTAIELLYDNYQFLAIGYSASERATDCVVSLATSPKGVALSFYYGASLPDPHGVLLGTGNQNRFVRLESAATLSEPAVARLIDAAVAQAHNPLPATGRGYTVVKSVSARQRPRR